jgi:Zn-dependent protease with chaperone function
MISLRARLAIFLGSRRLLVIAILLYLVLWALVLALAFIAPVDFVLLLIFSLFLLWLNQRGAILRVRKWQRRSLEFTDNSRFEQIKALLPVLSARLGLSTPSLAVYPSPEIGYQIVLGQTLCLSDGRLTATVEAASSEQLDETLILGHELAHLALGHARATLILAFFSLANRLLVLGLVFGLFSANFYENYWLVLPFLALGGWFLTLDLANLVSHAEEFEADRFCAQAFGGDTALAHAVNLLYYQNAVIVTWLTDDWVSRRRIMKILEQVTAVEPTVALINSGSQTFNATEFLKTLQIRNRQPRDLWTSFMIGNRTFANRLRYGFLESHPSCIDRWWALQPSPKTSATVN